MASNSKRALSELVSVDAWHLKFGEGVEKANLHLEVSFGDARLGGDNTAPVQFTVKLQRATVVVVMPKSNSIQAERSTVAREELPVVAVSEAKERKSEIGAKAETEFGPKKFFAKLGIFGSASSSRKQAVSSENTISGAIVRHFRNDSDEECWDVTPAAADYLLGRIWDGKVAPRFSMVDKRTAVEKQADHKNDIHPIVSVQVRCKREDLIIENIKVTDKEKQKTLSARKNQDIRLAAAESHIRDLLVQEGLGASEIGSDFVDIVLADIIAEAE